MPRGRPRCELACAFSVPAALSGTFGIPTRAAAPLAAFVVPSHHHRHTLSRTPSGPGLAHVRSRHDLAVHPDSLAKTLAAHRKRNLSSIIHEVRTGQDPSIHRPRFLDEEPNDFVDPAKQVLSALREDIARAERDAEGAVPQSDYEGRYLPPKARKNPVVNMPWLPPGVSSDPGERLNAEIESFSLFLAPTSREAEVRKLVIKDAQDIFKRDPSAMWPPHAYTRLFGSEKTGLATATSDIDLMFRLLYGKTGPKDRDAYRKSSRVSKLYAWLRIVKDSPRWDKVAFVPAVYPLINMRHRYTGISVQVVCGPNTKAAQDRISRSLNEFPTLKSVFAVLKQTFAVRGLLDVYRGGMGSYGVFNMLLASYVHNPTKEEVGARLLAFLEFWAKHDLYRDGVSIDPPLIFPKTRKVTPGLEETPPAEEEGDEWNPRLQEAPPTEEEGDEWNPGLEEMPPTGEEGDKSGSGDGEVPRPLKGNHIQLTPRGLKMLRRQQPYLLELKDPADRGNDLGSKTFAIKHIQATIAILEKELRFRLASGKHASLLAPLVGNDYSGFLAHRRDMVDNKWARNNSKVAMQPGPLIRQYRYTVQAAPRSD